MAHVDADVSVRTLSDRDGRALAAAFQAVGWDKRESLFMRYLADEAAGTRVCFVAELDAKLAGYVTLLLASGYAPFAAAGIPEICDLNVLPDARRRGVGNALMDAAEQAARDQGAPVVGLGVGLYDDYGSAQRIYVHRGYAPDGHGIMYDCAPVAPGASIRIDDAALLMMTKQFSN